jgi:hypothetical protein
MVVDNLDVFGDALTPDKANAPLVIDPDAVLAVAVTLEGFQSVTRRGTQVSQHFGIFDHIKFPRCHVRNRPQVPCRLITPEECLGGFAPEGFYHDSM